MITGAERRGMMTRLSGIADAFEDLPRLIQLRKAGEGDLTLERFCEACSLVSVLFGYLGLAFKFAELEYVAKLGDLIEASRSHSDILDIDITSDTMKTQGSHTRNLRRVRQGLDLIGTIFENFASSNDNSLKEAATTTNAKVCTPYHTWAVRTAVYPGCIPVKQGIDSC